MSSGRRSRVACASCLRILAAVSFLSAGACRGTPVDTASRPLADLIRALSEPGGYFDTDNLVSNETSYARVVGRLKPMGGAYIGVGPQQNFSYIARLRPEYAFIVDIRRENMLQHLLFHAIFHEAKTPYQYLCWLFAKPTSEEETIPARPSFETMVARFEKVTPSGERAEKNLGALLSYIQGELGMDLTPEDRDHLRSMYLSFFRDQLDIRFRSHGRPPRPHHPTLRALLMERCEDGSYGHFLASVEDYRYVRQLVLSGRLVPVVGDFAGSHALRAIGDFLRRRQLSVSAFYVSNVEFYLVRTERFRDYVDNVRHLPLNEESLFIRSYFDYGYPHPSHIPGHRSTMILQKMTRFLRFYDADVYRSYWDICTVDYMP